MKESTEILVGIVKNIENDIKKMDKTSLESVTLMKDRIATATVAVKIGKDNPLNTQDTDVYTKLLVRLTFLDIQF